jgi:hypothetical protein
MKLQTRRRIFYVFFLLFFVIGTIVILYAEGWRLNFGNLQAEKAGGIYVRSFPDSAQITLDGKPIQNQSAFLSRGTFISGLFPKTYTLKLSEADYDSWSEDALVLPSIVTEMKYAVLIPKTAINVATSQNVKAFFEVAGTVVSTAASGTITWHNAIIGRGEVISHSTNLKTIIIRSVNTKDIVPIYSLYDFTNATTTNLSTMLQASGIKTSLTPNVFIDPYDDTSILAETPAKIISLNSETHEPTAIDNAPAGTVIESPIAVSASDMAWSRFNASANTSQIIVYDKFSGDTIDASLIIPGKVKQLSWVRSNTLGILEENDSLYLYNVGAEQLTKLADDVKQFYPTPTGNAIAALEYHSLEVFSFTNANYYRFSLPDASSIQGLTWYQDDAHLFVQYSDRVALLDLADADLKNLTTISQGTKASYDPQQNSLYLIDQGQKLLRFTFPQ